MSSKGSMPTTSSRSWGKIAMSKPRATSTSRVASSSKGLGVVGRGDVEPLAVGGDVVARTGAGRDRLHRDAGAGDLGDHGHLQVDAQGDGGQGDVDGGPGDDLVVVEVDAVVERPLGVVLQEVGGEGQALEDAPLDGVEHVELVGHHVEVVAHLEPGGDPHADVQRPPTGRAVEAQALELPGRTPRSRPWSAPPPCPAGRRRAPAPASCPGSSRSRSRTPGCQPARRCSCC